MSGAYGWSVNSLDSVDSTQAVAARMAERGASHGTVVVAASQSFGKGRLGRAWISPVGGLYMSIVLRPGRQEGLQLLPLIGAFATSECMRTRYGLDSLLRWPNDVTIRARKVAGAIADSTFSGEDVAFVILGVGVNCNLTSESLGDLASSSTTLRDELSSRVDIDEFRDGVLDSLAALYSRWESGDRTLLRERTKQFSTVGKRIGLRLRDGGRIVTGTAIDIAEDGSLIARVDTDGTVVFSVDDVERLAEIS
jgi:BirA family biotin operon repressor/biotin-[acetyl-CoA-carboxylase] ligase